VNTLSGFHCKYRKLVETFHVVSEYKTAVYFSWQFVNFSVASGDSLTDSDLQLLIETEQDQTRH